MTDEPIWFEPCKIVNVTVPSFTVPAVLVTDALKGMVWLAELNDADAAAAVVLVASGATTVRVLLCGSDVAKLAVPSKIASMVYVPTGVPAGRNAFPAAVPPETDITNGPAICVSDPFKTVNVTLPSLTVPAGLLTVAESEIPSPLFSLKLAVASEVAMVVDAALTVKDSCRWMS